MPEPLQEHDLARRCAHLVMGNEVYGVGSVQKHYAAHLPGLLFISQLDGPMRDWLREADVRHRVGDFAVRFQIGGSATALLKAPAALWRARQDANRLGELLEREGIELLHVHNLPHLFMAGFLRRSRGIKVIFHVHNNTNPKRLGGLGIRVNWRIVRWAADAVIPVSDFIRANWSPSGVLCRTIRNVAPVVYPEPPDRPAPPPLRCLTAGRLTPGKGHHVAVEAVAAARDGGRDITLDCFGAGDGSDLDRRYLDTLHALAGRHLGDGIRLMGLDPNLRQRHRDYHLGLQCRPNAEPCSVWVCETLVDGLPLLASNTGGTPELVVDGETGRLYPPEDVGALQRLLEQAFDDPARLARWSAAAYERGKSFRVPRLIEQTVALYRDLLAPREPAARAGAS